MSDYILPIIFTIGTMWLFLLTFIVKQHGICLELLADDRRRELERRLKP